MTPEHKRWQPLFLFSLGLFAGTAFCMKWMEGDLWQNGQKFTIIGLEVSYSKERVAAILSGLDGHVKTILRYHLSFDFAFMAGVYPGIAALCMIARDKLQRRSIKKILFALAALQTVAWGCDIAENCYLLKWIKHPVIGDEFNTYHLVVAVKWIIAVAGALLAIPLAIRRRRSV
ncbi:MAG: hypothetical protein H7Y01_02195 [Ferruginibacter sp.]|nr:hypothetical protein [Chitinophagaceae bacterium]